MKTIYTSDYPAFDKTIIQDFNGEGTENVESTEFEDGFGCMPIKQPYVQPLPPEIPHEPISAEEQERRDYYYMTEDEKQRREDAYLAKHGIFF